MINEEQSKIIDRYLDNEMDVHEQSIFEAKIATDSQLAEALSIRKKAMQIIDQERYRKLRNDLIDRGQKRINSSSGSRSYLKLAASIALLLLAGYWAYSHFLPKEKTSIVLVSTEDIARQLKRPVIDGKLSGQYDENWEGVLGVYHKGKCDMAIPKLQEMLTDPIFKLSYRGQQAQLMLGFCLNEQGQPDQAIIQLRQVPQTTAMYREAQWCMAFAYLQKKDMEAAKSTFKRIAKDVQHPHQQEAESILLQMK